MTRKGKSRFAAFAKSTWRLARHGGFVLSSGMFIAAAVLWWRSERVYEQICSFTENNSFCIESREGAVIVAKDLNSAPQPDFVQALKYLSQCNYSQYWKRSVEIEEGYCHWGKVQFDIDRRILGFQMAGGGPYQPFVLRIPYWAPLTLFALTTWLLLPKALSLRAFRRRRWARTGRCHQCGYDLRASSGICPECGRPIDPMAKRSIDNPT